LHRITTEDNNQIYQLFELARRSAFHVDEAIDSILGELGDEAPEEPTDKDEDIPF
jgi:hypothetical protein